MSERTVIEWTEATWSPITGCSVISSGCKHCYAMKLAGTRLQHHSSRAGLTVDTKAGPVWTGEVRFNEKWLMQPISWQRPRMIFVCAHADLFHPAVPDEWIDRVFGVMWACLYGRNGAAGHVFQILTKRPERMRAYLHQDRLERWANAAIHYGGGCDPDGLYDQTMEKAKRPHPRIWFGVSVEDQAAADERIPVLLQTPAAVRWISAEPLLGHVDLCETFGMWWNKTMGGFESSHSSGFNRNPNNLAEKAVDWVVVGGESGPKARPMHPEWARSLRDQCAAAGVPFLFKQWGEWAPRSDCYHTFSDGSSCADRDPGATKWPCIRLTERGLNGHSLSNSDGGDDAYMQRIGKKEAGRRLDGIEHNGYPGESA